MFAPIEFRGKKRIGRIIADTVIVVGLDTGRVENVPLRFRLWLLPSLSPAVTHSHAAAAAE